MNDRVYRTQREKYKAVIEEVELMRTSGRPVLVGTTSVEISEMLSKMLQMRKIPHQVLNAKLHQKEADIVALAGQSAMGTVYVATDGRAFNEKSTAIGYQTRIEAEAAKKEKREPPYDHQSAMKFGMEMQDTYARLDRQLEDLFDFVEEKVGMDKTLFIVTSTGYFDSEELMDLSKYRIPTGVFSITKAKALLNMYLIAVYGPGDYVETAIDNQLYLNLKLIENRNLNLTEVLDRCSAFLIQLSGVKDVYTSQRLSLGAGTPGISKLRNAYNPKCSGDILIQVSPGWQLKNEDTHEQSLSRESYLSFPLFFLGAGIVPEKVRIPVSIDQVAPTVAQALRIRAPNACPQAPLNY